ncbi:MAG: DNA/RNA non-specific endonuclease [Bacteroidia bacterium]
MIKKVTLFASALGIMLYISSCQKDVEQGGQPILDEAAAASFADEDGMITSVERFDLINNQNPFTSTSNINLLTGNWNVINSTIINSLNENGKVLHMNTSAELAMNFDVATGISGVLFDYAKAGESDVTFELLVSKDGGATWNKQGETITASSTVKQNVAFYMDQHGNTRVKLKIISGDGLNVDNFTLQDNASTPKKDNNIGLGNPSNAKAQVNSPNNYLLVRPQYTLGYNNSKGNPKWVSWHLSTAWKGNAPRVDAFRFDEALPATFYKTTAANYNNIGFDRGHQCPSDDRDLTSADNKATFYMTDMLPQAPNLNRITWLALEDYCRTLASQGNELYIVSGGYGNGGSGSNGGTTNYVANGKVEVPERCWKAIVILTNGSNDKNRVNNNTRVIAVDMPNNMSVSNQSWGNYRVSVDAIEAATGLNLFSSVSTSVQNVIEAVVDNGPTQ